MECYWWINCSLNSEIIMDFYKDLVLFAQVLATFSCCQHKVDEAYIYHSRPIVWRVILCHWFEIISIRDTQTQKFINTGNYHCSGAIYYNNDRRVFIYILIKLWSPWLYVCLIEAVRTNPGYGMATLIYNYLLNLILGTVILLRSS